MGNSSLCTFVANLIQLILIAVLLLIIFYGLRQLIQASSTAATAGLRKSMIWLGLILLIVLSARFGWIIPALGAVALALARLLPVLLALTPLLRRIVHGGSRETNTSPNRGSMSREEAYQILGLAPGASREQILSAHRRLMQKLHPDRGGSDYLAGKINQARDILLSR